MKFVTPNDGQVYPEASPSGEQGVLLDTGWEVVWPGPARIYLAEVDIADILAAEGILDRTRVIDALTGHGWTSPAELARIVADFEQQLGQLEADAKKARDEADGLVLAIQRCAPPEVVARELEAAGRA